MECMCAFLTFPVVLFPVNAAAFSSKYIMTSICQATVNDKSVFWVSDLPPSRIVYLLLAARMFFFLLYLLIEKIYSNVHSPIGFAHKYALAERC